MTITFEWTPSADTGGAGTKEYQIQISTDINFGAIYYSTITSLINQATTLGQATYWWQVRARDYAGNISDWSSPFSVLIDTTPPEVPELLAPINGAATNQMTITFEWNPAIDTGGSGTKNYQLEVSTSPGFGIINYSTLTVQLNYTTAIAQATYYWHVKSYDYAGSSGSWSPSWTLLVDTTPPEVPELLAPINGAATNYMLVTFVWSAAMDSGGAGIKEYQLWVSTDPSFVQLNYSTTTVQINLDATFTLGQATYYWQVRAEDYAGNIGDWTSPLVF